MTLRLRHTLDPRTQQLSTDHVELHGSCAPFEPIEMLFEREGPTVGRSERLEHAVASLHNRIQGRDVFRRLAVDQDHGR